jgi:hypothetical protein
MHAERKSVAQAKPANLNGKITASRLASRGAQHSLRIAAHRFEQHNQEGKYFLEAEIFDE